MPVRSEDTYLFIDGEYLRRIHNAAMQSVFQCDGEINFEEIKEQARAKRVFLYDCIDDEQRPGETNPAFEARIKAQEVFFDDVKKVRGFHVRLGSVRGAGKRRRQKEVDVLLTVDMLTHGFDGNMETAILVAGDLDFRPVIEALVRGGVFVEVWYEPNSAARELPGAADFGRRLKFGDLYRWNTSAFQATYQLPKYSKTYSTTGSASTVRTGSCNGRKVEVMAQSGRPELFLTVQHPGGLDILEHPDQQVLERYASILFGAIEWR